MIITLNDVTIVAIYIFAYRMVLLDVLTSSGQTHGS